MHNIRELIRKLVEDTITEMSATGNVAGYETPFAFSRKSLTPKLTKRTKKIPNQKKNGYRTIPQGDPNGPSSKQLTNESVDKPEPGDTWSTPLFYVAMNQSGDVRYFPRSENGKAAAQKYAQCKERHAKVAQDQYDYKNPDPVPGPGGVIGTGRRKPPRTTARDRERRNISKRL